MATWDGNSWANLRDLKTTVGQFVSVYRPGAAGGELVDIVSPDGSHHFVHAPALHDWFLAAEDGMLIVYYSQIVAGGHQLQRVPSGVPCGQPVAAAVTGGTGPQGPSGPAGPPGPPGPQGLAGTALDDPTLQKLQLFIATAASGVVENVLLGPPAGDHYGLAPNARFGTRFQETIAVMLVNQAFWQEVLKAADQAVANLNLYHYPWQGLRALAPSLSQTVSRKISELQRQEAASEHPRSSDDPPGH